MHYPPVDYTAEEVHSLVSFLEQYIQHEPKADFKNELTRALAIVRAVDKIGKGTQWLSSMSNT